MFADRLSKIPEEIMFEQIKKKAIHENGMCSINRKDSPYGKIVSVRRRDGTKACDRFEPPEKMYSVRWAKWEPPRKCLKWEISGHKNFYALQCNVFSSKSKPKHSNVRTLKLLFPERTDTNSKQIFEKVVSVAARYLWTRPYPTHTIFTCRTIITYKTN